jgi:hypothetical protein
VNIKGFSFVSAGGAGGNATHESRNQGRGVFDNCANAIMHEVRIYDFIFHMTFTVERKGYEASGFSFFLFKIQTIQRLPKNQMNLPFHHSKNVPFPKTQTYLLD